VLAKELIRGFLQGFLRVLFSTRFELKDWIVGRLIAGTEVVVTKGLGGEGQVGTPFREGKDLEFQSIYHGVNVGTNYLPRMIKFENFEFIYGILNPN